MTVIELLNCDGDNYEKKIITIFSIYCRL